VLQLIERKAAGEEIAVQPQAEEPAAAPDLMAALEASLAAVRSPDDEDKPAPTKPSRRTRAARSGDGEEAPARAPRSRAKAKS
jgi:DNA end-binding protein Ku